MSGERLDELQADAEYYHDNDLWLGADTRAFMLRVIQLCEAYGRSRAALETAEAERDGLRDKVYDLLSLRHGSIDARRIKVNEKMGQDGE